MAKKKKFEHTITRPSLSASLEAVRQGKIVAPAEVSAEPVASAPAPHRLVTTEARFVKDEMRRIGLTMGALIATLIVFTLIEQRSGLLSRFVERLFQ